MWKSILEKVVSVLIEEIAQQLAAKAAAQPPATVPNPFQQGTGTTPFLK
jgi:hypothetical protein